MWLHNPLDDVLSSRAKAAVLRVLLAASGPLAGREIARRSGVGAGHASRVLRELAASGLLVARDQGRVVTYEIAHTDDPLIPRLQELFRAESERTEQVATGLTKGVPGVVSVILFGSEARGAARPGSDTDVLVAVRERSDAVEVRLRENALGLVESLSLALSWHLADLADIRDWEATGGQPLAGASSR
jgi:predicted nucleotidyltransferase